MKIETENSTTVDNELVKAYYSVLIENTADEVWAVARDFNDCSWAGEGISSRNENGKAGDVAGAVRVIETDEKSVKHILTVHSNADRFYTYVYFDTPPVPVHDYQATLRVTPSQESNNAYLEWVATFKCAGEEQAYLQKYYTDEMITWLNSLDQRLSKGE